jgi:hypothetical protein
VSQFSRCRPESSRSRSDTGFRDGIPRLGDHGSYLCLATAALAPDAAIHWLAGNHDQRLIDWLTDHAPQLIGLRRAGAGAQEPVIKAKLTA